MSYGVYMGIREDLCGFYGKLGSAFSKISREAFLTFLRELSKIPREGFFEIPSRGLFCVFLRFFRFF